MFENVMYLKKKSRFPCIVFSSFSKVISGGGKPWLAWAKFSQLSVFMNKALVEHSNTYLLIDDLWLLSIYSDRACDGDSMAFKTENIYYLVL